MDLLAGVIGLVGQGDRSDCGGARGDGGDRLHVHGHVHAGDGPGFAVVDQIGGVDRVTLDRS